VSDHVLLIGFMGAGKSAVGRTLAGRLGWPFIDLDRRIEAATGASVAEVFEQRGEESFRALEIAELGSLGDERSSVVACGGGIVTREAGLKLLAELGTVVFLRVGADEALRRIGDTRSRPLLAGDARSETERLLAARAALYERAADLVVETEGKSIAGVAREVESVLGREARE
jgi:shikimate kinase